MDTQQDMLAQDPTQLVWNLINAHAVARCIQLVAEFGVADVLGDAPATAADLAAGTGLDADALDRMLRLLVAHGVFAVDAQGYRHTPASQLLRSAHPRSLRAFARMIGLPAVWHGFTALRHAATTGRPEQDWPALLAHFDAHPDEAQLFNQAMVAKSMATIPAVVDAYDFTGFRRIADVGGGRGHLLQAILERAPGATGVLFDLPRVIADASGAASPRLELVAGDFFADPLPTADGYVLMEVLHDWNDADAMRILRALRAAAPSGARLLISETVIPDGPDPHPGKVLDIIMLAVTGGRERTAEAYRALLERSGWRMQRVIATASAHSLVEATPA